MSAVASTHRSFEREVAMITVGIDPHTRTHSAAALDAQGRVLDEITVGSNAAELDRLARWIEGVGTERTVAIEGARGFGLALCRKLLAAGERILDVAPALTASERRSARKAGKDDRRDAVAVARIALNERGLPCVSAEVAASHLKLLVDARDQLVSEATRVRNRIHALLVTIAPGYQERVRDLTTSSARTGPERRAGSPLSSQPYDGEVAPLVVRFAAGRAGPWRIERIDAVAGAPLPPAERLAVLEGPVDEEPPADWILRGVVSHERYVDRREREALAARQAALGRSGGHHIP